MLESGWSTGSSSSCWSAMAAWAWRSEARVTLVQVCDCLVLTPGSTGKAPGPAVAPPVDSPPMTNLDEQGRPEPPLAADEDSPEQLQTLWQDAVARSRSLVTEALADGGLERLARRPGTQPAMDPVPYDRGVRAAQRPCRPPPRVGGRAHRGVAAGRTAPS